MKTSVIILYILSGLAIASPLEKRQDFDFDAYNSAPNIPDIAAPVGDAAPQETVSYDSTKLATAAASLATAANSEAVVNKRQVACTTRSYNGPQVTTPTDTPEAFQSYAPFAVSATAAAQPAAIPSGYALVPDFINLAASVQDSHYLTYTTRGLSDYDPSICASKCNTMAGCISFNIYYERVPLLVSTKTGVPDKDTCPGTPTSPSATLLKCAFYGSPILARQATNTGQYQGSFHVVITGSNGYVKSTAPTLAGYQGPVSFGNAAINAPAPVINHGYLRSQTFGQNVPYDPSLCAASCKAQTDYNALHGDHGGRPCIFFDSYVLYKDGLNGVFTCVYYSTAYGSAFAKETGQYDSAGAHYTVSNSNGYYVDGNYVP